MPESVIGLLAADSGIVMRSPRRQRNKMGVAQGWDRDEYQYPQDSLDIADPLSDPMVP